MFFAPLLALIRLNSVQCRASSHNLCLEIGMYKLANLLLVSRVYIYTGVPYPASAPSKHSQGEVYSSILPIQI